jgi:hypothetical protein
VLEHVVVVSKDCHDLRRPKDGTSMG